MKTKPKLIGFSVFEKKKERRRGNKIDNKIKQRLWVSASRSDADFWQLRGKKEVGEEIGPGWALNSSEPEALGRFLANFEHGAAKSVHGSSTP